MKTLIFILLGPALSACHVKKEDKTEDISYSLNCNGCKTEKSFSSRAQYCATLLDEAENNSCCRTSREDLYNQNCK